MKRTILTLIIIVTSITMDAKEYRFSLIQADMNEKGEFVMELYGWQEGHGIINVGNEIISITSGENCINYEIYTKMEAAVDDDDDIYYFGYLLNKKSGLVTKVRRWGNVNESVMFEFMDHNTTMRYMAKEIR